MIPSPAPALFPSRWEVPCVAVVAENHPLAGKVVISAEDLAGNRLIAFVNSFRLRRGINDVLSSLGVELSVIDAMRPMFRFRGRAWVSVSQSSNRPPSWACR